MSVVFDFSDSLNDVAPVSPILLTVDVMKNEKSGLLMDVICVSSFFCLHHQDRVSRVMRLISMIRLIMLLPRLQYCFLLMKRKEKSELLMDVICVSSFVFTTQIEFSECCV